MYVKGGRLGTYSHRDWDDEGGKRSPKISWGVVITTNCHSTAPTWSQPEVPGRPDYFSQVKHNSPVTMHQAAESHKLISHQTAKTRHQTNFELMPSQNRRVSHGFTWFHMVSHGFTWFHPSKGCLKPWKRRGHHLGSRAFRSSASPKRDPLRRSTGNLRGWQSPCRVTSAGHPIINLPFG